MAYIPKSVRGTAEEMLWHQTEESFLKQVEQAAKSFNFKHYHTRQVAMCPNPRCRGQVICNRCGKRGVARGSNPGFPDLTMVGGKLLIFSELKRMGEDATDKQVEWLDVLSDVERVEVGLWRPDTLDDLLEVMRRG